MAADGFDAYAAELDRRAQANSIWVDDDAWGELDLPRRDWVAPGYAMRGAVTVVTGPPSAMKSSLMLAWAAAVALEVEHGRFRPRERGAVVVYNVEDDQTEQRRRLSAVLRQFDAVPADIRGKVIRTGPAGIGTLFARDDGSGTLAPTPALDRLRDLIREREPVMLIADPLAELHTADENDNTGLRAVVAEFRALATEFNIAVVLIHHTRKGALSPGDPDNARGASAIIGAARAVITLCPMSEDDAKGFGLNTGRKTRSAYVRLDDAKQNYAGIGEPVWYEKVLYELDNGEHVPAAVPWTPPNIWKSISPTVANAILDEIEAGIDGGKQRYSDAPKATDRAAWKVVVRHLPSFSEEQARSAIATWVKNAVLRREDYHDEADRKQRQGLFVNPAKRPGPR